MSDKARLRKQRDWGVQDRLRLETAVNALMQHADTRYFLSWLLEIGKIGIQPFTGQRESTDFSCGEYNVGLQVFALITATNPDGYITMLKEQENERSIRKRRDDDSTADDDGSGEGAAGE